MLFNAVEPLDEDEQCTAHGGNAAAMDSVRSPAV